VTKKTIERGDAKRAMQPPLGAFASE